MINRRSDLSGCEKNQAEMGSIQITRMKKGIDNSKNNKYWVKPVAAGELGRPLHGLIHCRYDTLPGFVKAYETSIHIVYTQPGSCTSRD